MTVWSGQTVSLFGDYVAYLTVPLFLKELTDRPFDFGLLSASENIATLIFGFIGGAMLDRFRLRRFVIVNEMLRALAFLILALLVRNTAQGESFSLWVLFLFAFIAGTLAASFNAALQAFIPTIVGATKLTAANSRLSLSQQIAFLTGPLIGGLIVKAAGFPAAFLFDSLTFVASALSFAVLTKTPARALDPAGDFIKDMREGWSHLWSDARIRLTTLGGALANFITGFIEATLVLIGAMVLGTDDPARLGVFFLGMGAGGILGALSANQVIARLDLGRTFVSGFGLFGLGMLALTYPRDLVVVTLLLAVSFIGLVWTNVSLLTMRQLYTPGHLLGRVNAAGRAIAWSTVPFGALFGTAIADRFGLLNIVRIGPAFILAFAIYLATTVVWSASAATDEASAP